MSSDQERSMLLIHAYGLGKRPPGPGSAIAWTEINTAKSFAKRIDGLGPHQAAYRAVFDALEHATVGSFVRIFCNSRLAFKVFNYGWQYDPLRGLDEAVSEVIIERRLDVSLKWLPPGRNRARKLVTELRTAHKLGR